MAMRLCAILTDHATPMLDFVGDNVFTIHLYALSSTTLLLQKSFSQTKSASGIPRQNSEIPHFIVSRLLHLLFNQSHPSHHNVSFCFPRFKIDKCLCLVETVKAYKEKTSSFCNDAKESCVFQSFIGKYGPVTSSTIGR